MSPIHGRFVLVWTLRVLNIFVLLAYVIQSYFWFKYEPTYESLNQNLGVLIFIATSMIGLSIINSKPTESRSGDQEYSPDEYAERLRADVMRRETLYVPLSGHLETNFEGYNNYLARNPAAVTDVFETIERAIATYDKFVLIGDPGSGKTTTLRHVTLVKLQEYHEARQQGHAAPLPLLINLGDNSNPANARALIDHWWRDKELIRGDPASDLQHGLVWLLFDGLNEMPDTEGGSIDRRAASLREFLNNYCGCAIVACHSGDYDERLNLGLPVVKILQLGAMQIEAFSSKHLGQRQADFQAALTEHPERAALARNPYALTMMIQLFALSDDNLQNSREKLFNKYIDECHFRNRAEKPPWHQIQRDLGTLKRAWGKLAYRMMLGGHGTTVDERWAKRRTAAADLWWLSPYGARNLEAGIDLGIIVRHNGKISFYHQLLYEHFALPLIDLKRRSVDQRVRLIKRLGNLEKIALPAVPKLLEVFLAESDNTDTRLYNAARNALISISASFYTSLHSSPHSEAARTFVCLLMLDTTLRLLSIFEKQDLVEFDVPGLAKGLLYAPALTQIHEAASAFADTSIDAHNVICNNISVHPVDRDVAEIITRPITEARSQAVLAAREFAGMLAHTCSLNINQPDSARERILEKLPALAAALTEQDRVSA